MVKSAYSVLLLRLPQSQPDIQQRKLLYMGLYLLIWGEASNIRFMPECLCYIFHNVSTNIMYVSRYLVP
jgi:callose synthase